MATTKRIGQPFILLDEVDSTNSYAIMQLKANLAEHGTAYFAQNQYKGRGQHSKTWFSEPNQNIILSVVVNTSTLSIQKQFQLSAMVPVTAQHFFNKYANSQITIKWPNDIYHNDSKAGGILIENIIQGQKWKWSIIGIGLNINQTTFPPNSGNPTSLHLITGQLYNAPALAKELCESLNQNYNQLIKHYNFIANYNQLLYKKNQLVKLKKDNISFHCIIDHVSEQGQLVVQQGLQPSFNFGEVQWIIPKNNEGLSSFTQT